MPPKKRVQTPIKPPEPQHPPPFTKPPESLKPFLPQLDPAQVYITHIDRTPLSVKRQTFFFALLLNASIAALLLWRAYIAIPYYIALALTSLGYDSSATVAADSDDKIWILVRRTAMMVFDFLLGRLVVPWPGSFFFEWANPVTWRWKVGFQAEEVVVRVCRNWEVKDLLKGEKKGQESPFFVTRILPAIDGETMEKTGYLMMDGSWDLDFGAMQDAHTLIKQGRVEMAEFETLVLVHQNALGYSGWLGWRFREVKQEAPAELQRKKLVAFKEMLASQGKESLFWKWQEVVEDERDPSGGFTTEAQERVHKKVKGIFEKEGVDFEDALKAVGNVQALPVATR